MFLFSVRLGAQEDSRGFRMLQKCNNNTAGPRKYFWIFLVLKRPRLGDAKTVQKTCSAARTAGEDDKSKKSVNRSSDGDEV